MSISLTIDRNALDDMLMQQPTMLLQASEAYANAMALRDKTKADLARLDADMSMQIRKSPVAWLGDAKMSEKAIDAAIVSHEVRAASEALYLQAKADAEKALALKDSVHQRGYMLRDLVSLHSMGYWANNNARGTPATQQLVHDAARERITQERVRLVEESKHV